ncbi:M16 family metallopeptidase [Buchananella hordeovulneris]|uniref:Peptidase M16 n=1 Tax=Buchananella hordeovulneris TaxID=52770 RepID=A0A1Q5PVJ0_9ACTO|nr:pitrilysin family protein [Buchananella hordeovulneris]OKL51577.1 peptidase M16 [Buchananella hordeovulneris]RRD44034.1 insulinase family protein [Buchananella hordeovulneris]RRD52165.1 insulinase family protein [Buchananella hordeovulneris]
MRNLIDLPLTGASSFTVAQADSTITRTVLPGGIRVISEHMPTQRSATIGAWVAAGSRDEQPGEYGSTHFLEHLLFKGTAQRDAATIAEAFDAVGGEANAATGKEFTAYHARVLAEDVPMAVEVLGDMVTSSVLDPLEFERERGVILDELAAAADDPHDVVHEEFAAAVYGDLSLARPIGGTLETVGELAVQSVRDHYERVYVSRELVVAAAGAVEHAALVELVERAVAAGGWDRTVGAQPVGRRAPGATVISSQEVAVREVVRPGEQAHVLLGCRGIAANDPRRWALSLLTAILGGGMSSRLFQEVREKRGWAYSTYAFDARYSDDGHFGLYAGCAPQLADDVAAVMLEQWQDLAATGPRPTELARAKGQLRGSMLMGLEDNGSRMFRLGRGEIIHGHLATLEHMVAGLEAVDEAAVAEVARELLARPRAVAQVSPRALSGALTDTVAAAR